MKINDDVFRAYDIRGIYPKDIDEGFAKLAAKAYHKFLGGKRIAVSMDVRISNKALTDPFIEGLLESGAEVWFIGVAPTPLLYFTVAHYGLDGGAAVSASHNPPEWNGFKLCGKHAKVFGWGEGLEKIKDLMVNEKFRIAESKGRLIDKHDEVFAAYENFVIKNNRMEKRLRIGMDPGNGACCGFAANILSDAKQDVIAINNNPDGHFPSRSPEPKPETVGDLIKLVKKDRLDFGVAFDGDGDRAIFVDDKGNVLGGDTVLALFANNSIEPGDKVVYEVSCSDAVKEVVEKRHAVPLVSKVGHSYIETMMLESNARMGGEISGHMYFRESYYFDDAFFAAAKMVELLCKKDRKLSGLIAELPQYYKKTIEFEISDRVKFKVIDKVRENLLRSRKELITIDGVKLITDDGWFILRASNTGPKIKMVAEARTEGRLSELLKIGKREFENAYTEVMKA
ncbi:MAG: phosphomannomutase/phosphoglucomutase [Candidatus Micrarchaeota archaeon]|nr:phosphomannomutase/phosphoglucomutase [Candidatus Micrarchaeota archaeon]MDE1833737.1 phosphomannomutase/phosphoglucomutase [Candidatus Micrarchaeota archaeon]MDE1859630.1 phosphomannomutase/phosphoglucomutase [Candidatus Micrarchaeota archaeon]